MKLGTFIQRCITVGRDTGIENRFAVRDRDLSGDGCEGASVLHGDYDRELGHTVLVGVDLGMGEILIADRLRERGEDIGLVLGHRTSCCRSHPRASFPGFRNRLKVRPDHDFLDDSHQPFAGGIPEKDVDAARLLDVTYACVDQGVHSLLTDWLQRKLDEAAPVSLGNLLTELEDVTEFKRTAGRGEPARIVCGEPRQAAGTVCVDTDSGSRGDSRRFAALKQAGVDTILVMNATQDQRDEADRLELHLVELDYLAADSLGLNLLIDHVYQGEAAPVILECSGFQRVDRDARGCTTQLRQQRQQA